MESTAKPTSYPPSLSAPTAELAINSFDLDNLPNCQDSDTAPCLRRKHSLEANQIKILVVPIGQISPSRFAHYLSILRSLRHLELCELTPIIGSNKGANNIQSPPSSQSFLDPSIFARQIGAKQGQIHLDFCTLLDLESNDFQNIQLYRRVFGAIGICCFADEQAITTSNHTKQDATLSKLNPPTAWYTQFTTSTLQPLPTILTSRLFAFEPPVDQPDNDKNIVVIPNQDEDRTKFYLSTMLNDLAISLLCKFEVLAGEIDRQNLFPSPRNLDTLLSKDLQNKLAQRMHGRRMKLMGDLLVLAGAYSEAVNCHVGSLVTSSEETKSSSDFLWHACAQEALQIALTLQSDLMLQGQDGDAINELWIALPEKLKETVFSYEKASLPRMTFDLYARTIVPLYISTNQRAEAALCLELAWSACCVGNISAAEKISIVARIILNFEAWEMQRKRSFYLRVMSLLLANTQEYQLALIMLQRAFSAHKIDNYVEMADSSCNSYQSSGIQFVLPTGWKRLQKCLLIEAISFAEKLEDSHQYLMLGFRLLEKALQLLDAEEQSHFYDKMTRRAHKDRSIIRNDNRCFSDGPYLPLAERADIGLLFVLKEIKLEPNSKRNGPEEEQRDKLTSEEKSGPFIYTPFIKSKISTRQSIGSRVSKSVDLKVVLVKEPIAVTVTFSNPFRFSLQLRALRLTGEGAGFTPEVTGLVLKGNLELKGQKDLQKVTFYGIANEPGILKITGFECSILGVIFNFPIDNQGTFCRPKSISTSNNVDKDENGDHQMGIVLRVVDQQPMIKAEIDSSSLFMYEGEERRMKLCLSNFGDSTPVNYLKIYTVNGKVEDEFSLSRGNAIQNQPYQANQSNLMQYWNSQQHQLFEKFDSGLVQLITMPESVLPIGPGQTAQFELKVYGRLEYNKISISIVYGYCSEKVAQLGDPPTSFYVRELEVQVSLTVVPSLYIQNLVVIPYCQLGASTMSPQLSSLSIDHSVFPRNEQISIDNHSNIEKRDGIYQLATEALSKLTLSSVPSLILDNYQDASEQSDDLTTANNVKPVKEKAMEESVLPYMTVNQDEWCYLVVDFSNEAEQSFIIKIDSANLAFEPVRIGPKSLQRVAIPVKRIYISSLQLEEPLPLSENQLVHLKNLARQEQRNNQLEHAKFKGTASAQHKQNTHNREERWELVQEKESFLIKRRLLETLGIGWKGMMGRRGQVSLVNLLISPKFHPSLTVPKFQFTLKIEQLDGAAALELAADSSIQIKLGKKCKVKVMAKSDIIKDCLQGTNTSMTIGCLCLVKSGVQTYSLASPSFPSGIGGEASSLVDQDNALIVNKLILINGTTWTNINIPVNGGGVEARKEYSEYTFEHTFEFIPISLGHLKLAPYVQEIGTDERISWSDKLVNIRIID